jgi:hypothetical protein
MLASVERMIADLPNLVPGSGRWLTAECMRECAARLDAGGGAVWMRELRACSAHLADRVDMPDGPLDQIRAERHRRRKCLRTCHILPASRVLGGGVLDSGGSWPVHPPYHPLAPCLRRYKRLAPACRHDHQTKQTPGWILTTPSPGTLIWTTPGNRTHTTTPAQYPE